MTRPGIGPLKIPRAPTVREEELAGGLHALAVRRQSVPLVEVRLTFPVAAAHIAKAAAPVVLAESLFAGTEQHDRAGIAAAVERLGGSLGSSLDGDRFDVSASVLAPRLAELLRLLAEVLVGATYPAGEVRGDRDRVSDETLIALSQPEVIASEALRSRLFAGHPYATEIPRPDALRRVTAGTLRNLHPVLLDPASAHLVLVGDLDPKRAFATAVDALGPWLDAASSAGAALPPIPEVRPGPLELIDRPGSVQSNIRVAGPAPSRSDPEWQAASLANLICGGLFASRLVENLRERNGYSYSPHSTINHGRAGSTFVVEAEVARAATAPALVETLYELGKIATSGVTDDELESARRYAVGSFTFTTATQSGLAAILSTLALAGIGPGYLTSHPARIAKTTRTEVGEVASRYFGPAGLVRIVVGEAETVAAPLAAVEQVVVREPPAR